MKKSAWQAGLLLFFFAFLGGVLGFAQTETTVIARMGMRHVATYHYFEVYQERCRWIAPDVVYIDFGKNNYREISIGGGAVLHNSTHWTIFQEVFFDQATGPGAHGALYLLPWTYIGYRITPKVRGETAYFPLLPLNKAARIQHIIERAKLEYDFKHFKVGAGYGAYQFGGDDWQHRPFLTTTFKGGRLGDLELWLQRLPGNHVQAQIRYRISFQSR